MTLIYREYGISHSSLEEVFLAITKKYDFKYEDELETFNVHHVEENESTSNDVPSKKAERKSYPYRALMW
jgi:hypothetical protein